MFLFYAILFIFGCAECLWLHGLFSSLGEQGLVFVAVHWFLIAVASLAVGHRPWGAWVSAVATGGSRAQAQ